MAPLCVLLAVWLLLALASPADSAAFVVALICGGVGLAGLMLIKDQRERAVLLSLFCFAYILRVCFTLFCYKMNLINVLGGEDDTIWERAWQHSLYWLYGVPDPAQAHPLIRAQTADTLLEVYDGSTMPNSGYRYFITYFYYLLNVRSQMAFSFLNCFLNSLVVVLVYKTAREFFSSKASLFAAMACAILPAYLVWSALTVKETWLILFEIATFFAVCRFARHHQWPFILLAVACIILAKGFRFYIGGVLLVAAVMSLICFRSRRPWQAVSFSLAGLAMLGVVLFALGIVRLDVASMVQSQMEEKVSFRTAVSTTGVAGNNSAVQLNYDISTPQGFAMMVMTGSVYLLLAPFPWQLLGSVSLRQFLTLPDILLWYTLVFVFIVPGFLYVWRQHPQLLIALCSFTLPLIIFYSLIFGNVGLVYRQRAQLMPFFLILVAAGYERRERARTDVKHQALVKVMKMRLRQGSPQVPLMTVPRSGL